MEITEDQDQRSPWQVGENVSPHLSFGLDRSKAQYYFTPKETNILASGLFSQEFICPTLTTPNHSLKLASPAARS